MRTAGLGPPARERPRCVLSRPVPPSADWCHSLVHTRVEDNQPWEPRTPGGSGGSMQGCVFVVLPHAGQGRGSRSGGESWSPTKGAAGSHRVSAPGGCPTTGPARSGRGHGRPRSTCPGTGRSPSVPVPPHFPEQSRDRRVVPGGSPASEGLARARVGLSLLPSIRSNEKRARGTARHDLPARRRFRFPAPGEGKSPLPPAPGPLPPARGALRPSCTGRSPPLAAPEPGFHGCTTRPGNGVRASVGQARGCSLAPASFCGSGAKA